MPWTQTNYPQPLEVLPPRARDKAIEIANELVASGHNTTAAITLAKLRARRWDRGDELPTKPKLSLGQLDHRANHFVTYEDGRWHVGLRGQSALVASFPTKLEAVVHGRELARAHRGRLLIYAEDQSIETIEDHTELVDRKPEPGVPDETLS